VSPPNREPIIASGWSGHVDFLHREYSLLVGGKLENVHPSAAAKDVILTEAQWFTPDDANVSQTYRTTFKHYKKNTTRQNIGKTRHSEGNT